VVAWPVSPLRSLSLFHSSSRLGDSTQRQHLQVVSLPPYFIVDPTTLNSHPHPLPSLSRPDPSLSIFHTSIVSHVTFADDRIQTNNVQRLLTTRPILQQTRYSTINIDLSYNRFLGLGLEKRSSSRGRSRRGDRLERRPTGSL
jgi:ATP adenylyltransferase/5',5'''-P-1,P-4-tetraphosphate phosphorylase II